MIVVAVLATVFVCARLYRAADGDVTRFVVAGDAFTDHRARPSGLFVFPGDGYDGQFSYRLAVDPFDWSDTHDGVRIDAPVRYERIAYPALVHLVAVGTEGNVPAALVVVNVVGLVAIAGLGASLARSSGHSGWWGLVFPAYFGFTATLARDLTEITEVVLLLAALLALRHNRALVASMALVLAVLSRETALFAVCGLAAYSIVAWWRTRRRPSAADLVWVAPLVVFAGWQVVVRLRTGSVGPSSGVRISYPGHDLVRSIPHWFEGLDSGTWQVHLAEGIALLTVVAVAAVALRWTRAPLRERWVFGALVAGMLLAWHPDGSLWLAPHDYRMFADVWVLSVLMVLGLRGRVLASSLVVPVGAAALTPIAAALWIRSI